jgi:hypothetical protein
MDEQERAYTLIKKLSQEDFPETSPFFSELGFLLPREKPLEGDVSSTFGDLSTIDLSE